MSTKIYETYDGSAKQGSSSLHHQLTQLQLKKRQNVALNKQQNQNALENAMNDTKMSQWADQVLVAPQRRVVTGLSCSECTPTSRKSATSSNRTLPGLNMLNLDTFRTPPNGMIQGPFSTIRHFAQVKSHNFPYIYGSVLQDETVQGAILKTAEEMAAELNLSDEKSLLYLLSTNKKRAYKILTRMHSKISNTFLKTLAWVLHKALPHLFKSVTVPAEQIDMLKEASTKGLPLIFLPLHRSHMDYIAVTFALCNAGLRSPLVAAGANLNIPFFGRLLQGLGAFFIKRRIDPISGKKDKIYRALLHTYMTHCIEAGHHFEFFIEGGRTRSGKPCMPKGGLMSVFVDAYLSGVLEDALLVPVSINYDRIVDGPFVNELTGEPKKPETFMGAIKGLWKAITDHYGMVRMDFNQPFSLHELVRSFQGSKMLMQGSTLHTVPSSASLYGTDVVVEDQRNLVDSIARHIIYDCAKSTAVMSTNALAFLLLHVHRKGATLGDLTYSLDVLRNELSLSGKDVGFTGESKDVLEYAMDLLGPNLVQKEKNSDGDLVVSPVTNLPNVIELAYYSNAILPHFALKSVLGLTLVSLTSSSHHNPPQVTIDKLIDTCIDLCEILQYEFIFTKTCQSLTDALYETIEDFTGSEILVRLNMPNATRNRNCDFEPEDDEDVAVQPQRYSVDVTNSKLSLYTSLIEPIIDAYTITSSHLKSLDGSGVDENVLMKDILAKTTSLIKEGMIPRGEALSSEYVKNCFKLLEKTSVVKVTVYAGKKIYTVDEERAEDALKRISLFDV